MRVLFLNPQQYVHYEQEPSNYELRLPMLRSGMVTDYLDYVYQEVLNEYNYEEMSSQLISRVIDFKPDIIVNSTTWANQNFSYFTLNYIRSLGYVVLTVMWDTHVISMKHELDLFGSSDFFVIADSVTNYAKYRLAAEMLGQHEKVLFLGGSQVLSSIFRPVPGDKHYDVLIPGSQQGRRIQLTNFLFQRFEGSHYRIATKGGLVDSRSGLRPHDGLSAEWIDWEHYVFEINLAEMVIVSQTEEDRSQIKGKLFECLACGVLVLAERIFDLSVLIPNDCIVFYDNLDDLYQKIVYYSENKKVANIISENGRRWFLDNFNAEDYWKGFFGFLKNKNPFPHMHSSVEEFYRSKVKIAHNSTNYFVGVAEQFCKIGSTNDNLSKNFTMEHIGNYNDFKIYQISKLGYFASVTPYFDIYVDNAKNFEIYSIPTVHLKLTRRTDVFHNNDLDKVILAINLAGEVNLVSDTLLSSKFENNQQRSS